MQQGAVPAGFASETATAGYQVEDAVAEDGGRRSIRDTFCEAPGAIADGVDLRGYFLLDNLERAFSSRRFDLVHGYEAQQRIVNDSGRWFATVAANNELP